MHCGENDAEFGRKCLQYKQQAHGVGAAGNGRGKVVAGLHHLITANGAQDTVEHNSHCGTGHAHDLRTTMKSTKWIIIACFIATTVAHAQQYSFGVKGGFTPTKGTEYSGDESKRYVVGPVFEMRWGRIALEVGFLYRRLGRTDLFSSVLTGENLINIGPSRLLANRTRSNVLDLPVLGKYYFRRERKLQPFFGTGYAFRKVQNTTEGEYVSVVNNVVTPTRYKQDWWSDLNIGVIAATGLQWKWRGFALTPEVRYTRWNRDNVTGARRNQVEVLFGFTF
jgi:hypothetical protein